MKERPILFSAHMVRAILDGRKTQTRRPVKNLGFVTGIGHVLNGSDDRSEWPDFCPHGKLGDRLWVRETWSQHPQFADIAFRADGEEFEDSDGFTWIPKWKPSIHMPRKASRIDLEITGVRVERLHDISEEDAIAEGVQITDEHTGCADDIDSHAHAYKFIWESINGKGSWDLNPFVWVVEFKRIEK